MDLQCGTKLASVSPDGGAAIRAHLLADEAFVSFGHR